MKKIIIVKQFKVIILIIKIQLLMKQIKLKNMIKIFRYIVNLDKLENQKQVKMIKKQFLNNILINYIFRINHQINKCIQLKKLKIIIKLKINIKINLCQKIQLIVIPKKM